MEGVRTVPLLPAWSPCCQARTCCLLVLCLIRFQGTRVWLSRGMKRKSHHPWLQTLPWSQVWWVYALTAEEMSVSWVIEVSSIPALASEKGMGGGGSALSTGYHVCVRNGNFFRFPAVQGHLLKGGVFCQGRKATLHTRALVHLFRPLVLKKEFWRLIGMKIFTLG